MNDVSKKVEKSLHISQDVIAQIVTNSVNEIEGVYGIAPVMKNFHVSSGLDRKISAISG